jgi:protein SCO1/2
MEEPQFNRRTLFVGGGLVIFAAVAFVLTPLILMVVAPHYHGTLYDDPQVADFTLPRADGGTFRLSDHRGQVVAIYFGYTSCPDVCPTTLYDLHRTLEALGDQAQNVVVAFVTIDPATDTPERLAAYLTAFDPGFIGLYGTPDQLQPVYDRFDVTVIPDEQTVGSYGLAHTGSVFVMDRAGRLRLRMHSGARPQEMASDLRTFLRERTP